MVPASWGTLCWTMSSFSLFQLSCARPSHFSCTQTISISDSRRRRRRSAVTHTFTPDRLLFEESKTRVEILILIESFSHYLHKCFRINFGFVCVISLRAPTCLIRIWRLSLFRSSLAAVENVGYIVWFGFASKYNFKALIAEMGNS